MNIFFQFLCGFAHFLINWNMGMVLAIASIVVPSVIGTSKHLNPDEIFHMTTVQASWLGTEITKFSNFLIKYC